MKKYSLLTLITILVLLVALGLFSHTQRQAAMLRAIDSYESCAAAGYPILETYPEQCMLPDGRSFTRVIDLE